MQVDTTSIFSGLTNDRRVRSFELQFVPFSLVTRKAASKNSLGQLRFVQTRPSELKLKFQGDHLFVVFFCGIVAFSIISSLILKNEFIFRVQVPSWIVASSTVSASSEQQIAGNLC